MRRLLLPVLLLLAAGSARADIRQVPGVIVEADSLPPALPADTIAAGYDFVLTPELLESLGEEDCPTIAGYAYRALPFWIVGGQAAAVFDFLYFWESRCGAGEPIQRMWILATIWEGAFDESYYGEDIPDYLIERWEDPGDRSTLREDFDAFTVDMADQMLPHQPRGSVEEFWCLFYSGRVGEAYALLDGSSLTDSWVRHYRDETVAYHRKSDRFGVMMLTGGYWRPGGDMAFVGDKPTWGFLGGMRGRDWLVRGVIEVRVGRTDEPYLTEESSRYGRSNRFDGTLFALELGRIVHLSPRQAIDLFFGLGADMVVPYRDQDVVLVGGHVGVGAGYRYFAGKYRNWVLGVDVRREWTGERNPGPYSMSGSAWSFRLGIGYAFVKDRNRTLEGLGR
jgi:hypothetical protein